MNNQNSFEYFAFFIVVFFELVVFLYSLKAISRLLRFFPYIEYDDNLLSVTYEGGNEKILLNERDSFSSDFNLVLKSINNYLVKNKGVIDFNIIKSIVERKVESIENTSGANISLPLYIGLMGTFIGIILGLYPLAFGVNLSDAANIPIKGLLLGVVIAMCGSLFGLLFTVINTSFFMKRALARSDYDKNLFYDFLQVELLPHLQSGLFQALDRLAVNINDFNNKFQSNIQLFDNKFAVNISLLNESVGSLCSNMTAIIANTTSQQEFLKEIKNIGYNKMAEANIKVFSLLNDALPTLLIFIEKQKELNSSVKDASLVVNTIQGIMDRVKSFEISINNLGENISTKEYLGNETLQRIDKNLSYLDKQYELLKQHGVESSDKIEDFFMSESKRISNLTTTIVKEVQEALSIDVASNPFQKLLLLESVDNQLKNMNELITLREVDFQKNAIDLKISVKDISSKLDYLSPKSNLNVKRNNRSYKALGDNEDTVRDNGLIKRIKLFFKFKDEGQV